MTQHSLLRPDGLVQSPAFSHVAVVPPGATMIYIGGQNAVTADGTLVGGDDIAAQTQQVMTNLLVALAAAGGTVHDLVMLTVLLVEDVDLGWAYPVAAAALAGAAPPVVVARVAGLAVPGALVEVSAVAAGGAGIASGASQAPAGHAGSAGGAGIASGASQAPAGHADSAVSR